MVAMPGKGQSSARHDTARRREREKEEGTKRSNSLSMFIIQSRILGRVLQQLLPLIVGTIPLGLMKVCWRSLPPSCWANDLPHKDLWDLYIYDLRLWWWCGGGGVGETRRRGGDGGITLAEESRGKEDETGGKDDEVDDVL